MICIGHGGGRMLYVCLLDLKLNYNVMAMYLEWKVKYVL